MSNLPDMKLLDENFNPPEFTRITYHSLEAREFWGKLITIANMVTNEAELRAVAEGLRRCATLHIPNVDGDKVYKQLAHYGLKWERMKKIGSGSGFSHKAHPPPGETDHYYWFTVAGKNEEDIEQFVLAEKNGNHVMMGDELGFSQCCIDHFSRVWPKYCDPIYQQAQATENAYLVEYPPTEAPTVVARVVGHPYCNAALRYMGTRVWFHLPCKFDCEHTIERGKEWLDVVRDIEPPAVAALEHLLSLPMSWDVNHGYAKIITPAFTLHAGSVASAQRYIVQIDTDENMTSYKSIKEIPGAVQGSVWPFCE
ncbi:MAG: hypothetical protein ACXABY_12800 [Candidatus Thorarchaeota archaeon]|jgi:hypothetical protein